MKKVLVIALLIAGSLVFFHGNALAVLGAADNVPGHDVVFPIICEKNGSLNTTWAIANVFSSGGTANATVRVYSATSSFLDSSNTMSWTPFDVESGDCQTLVATLSAADRTALEKTINSVVYYVGYVFIENNVSKYDERFISWVYVLDLVKGFASGFKGFQAEGWAGTSTLSEYSPSDVKNAIKGDRLWGRFILMNNNADTFNWLMLLLGDSNATAQLYYRDENENTVVTGNIALQEMNVLNVEDNMPGGLFSGYPKYGYILITIDEGDSSYDTVLGWMYQRYKATTIEGSWDAIHEIDRHCFVC